MYLSLCLTSCVCCSAVENYKTSNAEGFDGLIVLQCIGNFIGVFSGAFALGSGMGCITALVSLCCSECSVTHSVLSLTIEVCSGTQDFCTVIPGIILTEQLGDYRTASFALLHCG